MCEGFGDTCNSIRLACMDVSSSWLVQSRRRCRAPPPTISPIQVALDIPEFGIGEAACNTVLASASAAKVCKICQSEGSSVCTAGLMAMWSRPGGTDDAEGCGACCRKPSLREPPMTSSTISPEAKGSLVCWLAETSASKVVWKCWPPTMAGQSVRTRSHKLMRLNKWSMLMCVRPSSRNVKYAYALARASKMWSGDSCNHLLKPLVDMWAYLVEIVRVHHQQKSPQKIFKPHFRPELRSCLSM